MSVRKSIWEETMTDPSSIDALTSNVKTLHDISSDNANSEYMTESTFPAVDFDGAKDSYSLKCGGSTRGCRSNDALVILEPGKQNFIFIEFKNGCISSSRELEKIRSKIAESLLIFNDMLGENLSFDREHINYILVYNQSKNSSFEQDRGSYLTKMVTILGKYSKMDYLIKGFDHYRLFFNKVQTLNEIEFKEITDALENKTYSF